MTIAKKNERGLCPFNGFKKCNEKCTLFRKGVIYKEKSSEVIPIESCSINIIADNAEVTHTRIYTLQKEFGEMKNMSAFSTLVALGLESEDNLARIVKACMNLPDKTIISIDETKKQNLIEDKPVSKNKKRKESK